MTSTLTRNSDHIRALVCGFASPLRENRLLAMLVGYVDDSGSHPNNENAFVLAGFISTSEKWANFSDEWEALCKQPPKTIDFKMKIAERLKGAGTYWGQGTEEELIQRRDMKLQALALLIRKYAICRIHAGLDWRNYRAFAQEKVPHEVDSPYFFLFWNLIAEIANHQERTGVKEKIDFVFDEQGTIGQTAVLWHSTLLTALPPFHQYILSSTPIFRHDSDVLPLKAADMLAWHMNRHVDEYVLADTDNPPLRRSVLASLLELPNIHANINGDHLKEIVREVNYVKEIL